MLVEQIAELCLNVPVAAISVAQAQIGGGEAMVDLVEIRFVCGGLATNSQARAPSAPLTIQVDAPTPFGLPGNADTCLLYTSPSPRDRTRPRMPSSA